MPPRFAVAVAAAIAASSVASAVLDTVDPDMLMHFDADLPAGCFVAVHAENRSGTGPWQNETDDYQPFLSFVDRQQQQVYWHKDDPLDFYGEVWNYDDDHIMLRMETFPHFPDDPPGVWDARPDKFRLFARQTCAGQCAGSTADAFPYAQGRVLAPRNLSTTWAYSDLINTYLCSNWTEFEAGTCAPFQLDFVDDAVTVEVIAPFSTVFDGTAAGWPADPAYESFEYAVVISQIMGGGGGVSRERFFFATAAGDTHYGIVRWDASSRVDGDWQVQYRTVGLKTMCSANFSSVGMPARGAYDRYPRSAGLRLVASPGELRTCPPPLVAAGGNFTLPSPQIYDLSGFNTRSGGTVAVCVAPGLQPQATLTAQCGMSDADGWGLGSLYVDQAVVQQSLFNESTVTVSGGGWVVWCSHFPLNSTAAAGGPYWALADGGCAAGGQNSGSLIAFKDAYDAFGRRVGPNSSMWMVLCAF